MKKFFFETETEFFRRAERKFVRNLRGSGNRIIEGSAARALLSSLRVDLPIYNESYWVARNFGGAYALRFCPWISIGTLGYIRSDAEALLDMGIRTVYVVPHKWVYPKAVPTVMFVAYDKLDQQSEFQKELVEFFKRTQRPIVTQTELFKVAG